MYGGEGRALAYSAMLKATGKSGEGAKVGKFTFCNCYILQES